MAIVKCGGTLCVSSVMVQLHLCTLVSCWIDGQGDCSGEPVGQSDVCKIRSSWCRKYDDPTSPLTGSRVERRFTYSPATRVRVARPWVLLGDPR